MKRDKIWAGGEDKHLKRQVLGNKEQESRVTILVARREIGEASEHIEICGFRKHSTKDCHRMLCQIYGLNNQITYNCKKCLA